MAMKRGNGIALASSLALLVPLLPAPLAAQDGDFPTRLEDLIPDEAVANPEEWASRGVSRAAAAAETDEPELAADSPFDDMPLVTIPWPEDVELAEIEPLEPEEPIEFAVLEEAQAAVEMGSEERLSSELVLVFPSDTSLFPVRDEFLARFESLSTVEELDSDENVARLAAQSRADEELLQRMLRVYGYYDAQVIRSLSNDPAAGNSNGAPAIVRFDIIPGPQFMVGAVDLGQLNQTGPDYPALHNRFGVFPGDPLLMDVIEDAQYSLDAALGETGYPFAVIEPPELLVDHERREGDVTMPVMPGGKYNFGSVVSALPDFLSSRHLAAIARFDPGDLYQRSDEMDLRRAILATGLVGSVTVTPVERTAPSGDQPGTVDMEVDMVAGPLRTIAGSIGFGTGEGFRLAGRWEHRNLFPPEGMLRVRGIAGTREQLAGVTLRKNNFRGRDRILTADAYASNIEFEAYDARTVSLVTTYEKVSNLLFQKPFSWSGGLELVATAERPRLADRSFGLRETYFVAAVPLYAQIDTSDDLLDPTRGFRISGRLSPEVSRNQGTQSFYLRSQADFSYYQQMGENVVLAGRVRLASIPGADVGSIAPSRRLYAGGGGSVRGYGYRQIGPLNSTGDPIGGRSLTEFAIEARIRTGLMGGAIGVVPFIDAGTVGSGSTPGFDEIKFGAGIGIRYLSDFGPLRLDIATPLNPGPNDGPVAVYVALGQAF